ncbi:MAG: diaminopimelate dehydrogenase [Ruthenibacterium sp.]
MTTQIGIFGYGNLGRGVETAIRQNKDMALAAVFTRRKPETLQIATSGVPVLSADAVDDWTKKLDVLILCGGSATDLPVQTPALAKKFTLVDSFDTHAGIPAHFDAVDAAARESGHLAVISAGWDPGLFSILRTYGEAALPVGATHTFWGRGVSQGHSDAIRRIDGVLDARQYTVPISAALAAVRSGDAPALTARQKHTRVCFVVAAEDADKARIEREIVTMPNYFADYDTTVTFVSAETLRTEHSGMPHGDFVFRSGKTGISNEHTHLMEFALTLDSNPEFTSNLLVATARAAHRLFVEGAHGCKTLPDIPPAYLCVESGAWLRKNLL